jgi:aspartyl-tRNA(Asn)/glutamyl-tRNA(Gln) amidotransferase subunit A
MTAIADLTSGDLLRLYERRVLSPVEVAADVLTRIEGARAINAFLPIAHEAVLAAARASEKRWFAGAPLGRADGIPTSVKDNIWAAGLPTLKGSKTGERGPAPEDAPAVARLREQGAVILGKTAMPEHGWIGVCHSPLTGITRNPWSPNRTTGGSTGGGAAAALLSLGNFHLGTDGAGSLRIPAAFTGVFGMKPSFGRVPVYPPSPLSVLSHQGPITRTVVDAAIMLSIISQPDGRDMAAWNTSALDYRAGLEGGVQGLRIAWSARLGQAHALDEEVYAACLRAVQLLSDQGADVGAEDPDLAGAGELIRTLWWSVAASLVATIPESERKQMDPGFLQVAEWGRGIALDDYIAAYSARSELHRAMLAFHARYDLLLTPTMPLTAFEAGAQSPPGRGYGDDWLNWSPYTYPFNLTQQPAASVPVGLSKAGLPIGLQIVGPRGADLLVLRAARAIERAQPFPQWRAVSPADTTA